MMEREARSTAVVKKAGVESKLHELEELRQVLLDKKPDEFNHLATFVALNEKVLKTYPMFISHTHTHTHTHNTHTHTHTHTHTQ